ncbi:acetate non-utilizing protein 9 [Desmophyllum pertusum]|uniref:Succinate dehydrogenase assembly factor 3 n=1 Tax=Desmophyllum pertusum TaxID=174260 RepID=A0A9X0D500_9CNID|nr:acetate non-utilizing protein 9 [Desmophyllum pertusum]
MNPALRLYRRILNLHKNLPVTSKALGDQYLKDEFRRHKNATREQITEFIQEWKMYADLLERQQQQGKGLGSQLSEDQLSSVNEEQLHQLYALHQEITTPSDNSDSTQRS